METSKRFYMERDHESFIYRNKIAIVFYVASGIFISLGIIPWMVGWYNIIF